MAIPIIAARSLNIAKNLIVSSKVMAKGAYSSVSSTISRTGEKIKSTNAKIVAEKNKQADINRKKSENESRAAKENNVENTNKKKGAVLGLVSVVKKSIMGFWKIIGAWLLDNLPRIITEVRKFVKKVRIVGAAIKRAVSLVGSVFSSIGKIAKAVVKNILNFDFTDKSGEVRVAKEELDVSIDGIGSSISEIGTVWGREEDELDYILTQFQSNQNLENIRKNILSEFPEVENGTSAFGDGSSPSSGAGMAGGAAPAATQISSGMGFGDGEWDVFRNTIAKIESGGKYDIAGGSGGHYDGRYQMGADAKTDAAKYLGEKNPGHTPAARAAFRADPAMQERYFAAYTLANHKYLMRNPKYEQANKQRRLQILGYAHNQGMGNAEKWLNTGKVGADGFGTKGSVYSDSIAQNFRNQDTSGGLGADMVAKGDQAIAAPAQPQAQAPQPANGSTGTTVNDEYKGGMSKSIVKTSGYGYRKHPILGVRKMHKGIDIAPPGPGYKVALKVPGEVTRVTTQRGYGNFVIITSQQTGMSYMFAHLKTAYVRQGDAYTGQAIGEIGNTGLGTGIHLHFEVYKGGKDGPEVNPEPYRHLLSIGKGISKQKAATTKSNNVSSAKSEELSKIASRRTGGTQVVNNTTLFKQDRYLLTD